jgi:hypothetical protein
MRTLLLNEIKKEMPNSQALGAFNDSQSSGSGYNATLTSGGDIRVRDIFDDLKGINPNTSQVSSMGSVVTPLQRQMADEKRNEIVNNLDKNSLAFKIMQQAGDKLTDKQIGVVAYELNKNNEYKNKLGESKSNLANKAKDIRESKNSRKEFKKKKKMGINTTLPSNR